MWEIALKSAGASFKAHLQHMINDDTAMLAYSDFFVPDKDGSKRKSITVRTTHVDSA